MTQKILIVLTIISSLFLIGCSSNKQSETKKRVLPIIGDYDIEYKDVNGEEIADTIYPKMIDFTFLNQDSVLISKKELENKIWIADFFFTTCPTICPTMTKNLKWLNEHTKDIQNQLQFFSNP